MQAKLSRRKIADYVATSIANGGDVNEVLKQVAAYLLEARRTREVELVIRAIEGTLAERSIVVGTVTTARPLDTTLRESVKALIAAKSVYLREVVNPAVLGGVLVETPGKKFDATIQRKILALSRAKQ